MMATWYSEMLADVDGLVSLVDQIGAYDDRHRPYRTVVAELRADAFVAVQSAVRDLANRIHTARERGVVDEGILAETMALLIDLAPYMRSVGTGGVECEGGFACLVARIEKLLGSILMTVRSFMGIIDETPEIPW